MSKPKKGYRRKSVDLKEKTLAKIERAVIGKSETPKEFLENLIENSMNASKLT